MTLRKISILCVALLLAASLGMAQSKDTGTFIGTVFDIEGTALPGVTVTAKNVQMGLIQSTVSNDQGRYRIEKLPRGMYTLTAAIQGFKTMTREGLELMIGGEVKINFNLELGRIEENITVVAVSPLVETTRAQVSTLITEKEFLSYPQGNRDYTALIAYAPGTLPGAGRSGYAINGMRGSSNNFQIDGIDNNDNGTATNAVTSMPPESIQEFRLVSNNFSAEYGRNSGGVINAVMKSGTNEFHGNAWIFHRGDSALFQSEDWLTHDLPPYKRFQYGATVGGPIKKDKTFFFASFEGVIQDDEARDPLLFYTPEAIGRSKGAAKYFFDKYGADYPKPTYDFVDVDGDGLIDAGRYVWDGTAKTRGYNFGLKIDHIFSEKDRVAFRWLFNTANYEWDFAQLPGNIKKNPYSYHTGGLTWLHLFGPTMYNEVRIGYHRDYADWPRLAPEVPSLGGYSFSDGVTVIGDYPNMPQSFTNNTYQLVDVLNFQVGNHSIKVGGEARLWNSDSMFDANVAGSYYFVDSTWFLYDLGAYYLVIGADPPDSPEGNPYVTGDALGEWKIGDSRRKWKGLEGGLFVQDDWRVTDKLTVSLGLRWEYYGVPKETSGKGINMPAFGTKEGFDSKTLIEGKEGVEGIKYLIFDGRQKLGKGLWNPYYKAFAPKASFAYDLTGDGKTSLRAGAGISYDRTFNNTYENDRFNYPDFTFCGLPGEPYGYPIIRPTFPGTVPVQNVAGYRAALRWMLPDLMPQKAYNWLVGIQRELSTNVSIELNYTGSKGVNLGSIQRPNRFTGDGVDKVASGINAYTAIRDLNLRTQNLKSDYHAFTATINKRFADGWSWYTAYTFGVAKDQNSDYFGEGGTGSGTVMEAVSNERIGDEYGYAQFDRRHRVVGGMIYDLPFFKDSKNWFLKNVIAGWQISSNFHFTSGAPFTIRGAASSTDWNKDYDYNDRPLWLGGDNYQDIISWTGGKPGWNKSSFGIPNAPKTANDLTYYDQKFSPRNAFKWFPTHNVNIALQKYWTVPMAGREFTVQAIFEVFNVLKSYFWDLPSTSWTSVNFGKSLRMSGQRTSQVSLRIMF